VAFGLSASESTTKIATALPILGKEATWITLSFDDAPLAGVEGRDPNTITPGSVAAMGVKSDEWKLLSGGRSCMPALAIDGQVYMDADEIVKMLAVMSNAPAEVLDLIDHSRANTHELLEALKHWGWCAMHASQGYAMVNKDHYDTLGQGNQSSSWETAKADLIKAFLGKLEATLAAKPSINGFYVGDSLTLADASLINWPLSLSGVAGLNVELEYPKLWKHWQLVQASPPKGSEPFIFGFPMFCGYVAAANKAGREAGFDINKYWLLSKTSREYLEQFGVQAALSEAVATVLRDRPGNPVAAIAELLKSK